MADISKIKLPSGTTYNIKDSISGYTTNTGTITKVQTTAGAHTTINVSSGAATFNVPTKTSHLTNDSGFITDAGVTGVKGNAESSYRTGQVNLTAANIGAIPSNSNGNTQNLYRPLQLNGLGDNTLDAKINTLRANRLAFLPADQIIIEKTTNGGSTWSDAGVSDANKVGLFSETRAGVSIPLLNGVKNINCGLRITITGMKYNVPSGTAETSKYNYWNSNYITSTERYNQLKEMYFWVSANSDTISVKVERATGAASTTWNTIFDNSNYGMTGWSGNDYIRFSQGVFGGGTTQTSNYWNYRLTFFTRGPGGSTTLSGTNTTSAQVIQEIRAYGDTWWTAGNEYAANDHLYTHDYLKNATFPAKVTASGGFSGNLTGNVTGNVSGSAGSVAWSGVSSKPTTLSGYGITDAKIASGTITLGSNTITPLTSSSTLDASKLSGAIPSAVTATTQSAGNNSTKIATTAYVDGAISGLPTPMQFIGTVGTNGTKTWANLPAAAASNEGHTYKVITDHAAETGKPAAKAGDTIVSNGSSWIVIPSGDETATQSATTGITVSDHSTTSLIGVQSSTTSVTGVSGSTTVRGVKTGTGSTTTASKVTLGTAISVPNVTGATDVTVPIRADSATTVPIKATSATTVPIRNVNTTAIPLAAASATTVPIKNASATSIPNVTAVGSGSASLTFTMDTTDTKKLKIAFSHTHTAPTLGTAISLIGVQSSTTSVTGVDGSTSIYGVQADTTTVTGVQSSTTSVTGVKTGTSSTTIASKVALGTAISVPNVTGATDVTVPIRADADTTVPIAASSATTVPIKNTSSTTVVTSKTHTVNDSGHTHTI